MELNGILFNSFHFIPFLHKWKSVSSIPAVSLVRHLGWILVMSVIQRCSAVRVRRAFAKSWGNIMKPPLSCFLYQFFPSHFSCWSSNMVFYCVSKKTIFTGSCLFSVFFFLYKMYFAAFFFFQPFCASSVKHALPSFQSELCLVNPVCLKSERSCI